MKKLLFILSAILVSVISLGQSVDPNSGWAHLNPFAYDLKSEVKSDGTIDLIFSLNANAIPSDGGGKTYEKLNDEGRGVQIYILDEHETVVHTILVPSTKINKGTHTINLSYNDIPKAYWGKPLSWEVTVWGNKGRTGQKQILDYTAINTASGFYPKNVHGIAIEKNPNNPHFGKIFISEACTTSTPGKNSLLEYDMLLKYQGFHHKDYVQNNSGIADSHFSKTVNYEPHRVKISEDGRIFVTCYHPTASHAVLEYMGSGIYKSIIKCKGGKVSEGGNIDDNDDAPKDWGYGPHEKYNRRPIAMDVIGRGNDLKIIVAWISPKGWYPTNNKGNWRSQVEIIEYAVGENGCDIMQDEGTIVATWKDKASSDTNAGYLFQQYFNVGTKSVPAATHGFVDISYDNDGDIWLKVDYAYSKNWVGEVYLFKREENDTKKEHDYLYSFSNNGTLSYGANGICIIKNKNDQYELFTGSATDQIAKFTINKNISSVISNMNTYTQTADGSLRVVGIAEDYAGNLYFLNNRGDETNDDNVVVFAMPYDGKRVTRSQTTFNVSAPVPNILATNLKYEPAGTTDNYTFSFITNTKPTIAEIRFYRKENLVKMEDNIATIHADNYQKGRAGHETQAPDYVYTFPTGELKQGLMSATFKMVGGDANSSTITDALPPGELYWSVYVEAPCKSTSSVPIYREEVAFNFNVDGKRKRKHIVVNNYPETDLFGTIIAANYENQTTTNSTTGVIHQERGLLFYGINDQGIDDSATPPTESSSTNNRYTLLPIKYLNGATSDKSFLNYPRRMAVAPDGKIYIADEGATGLPENVNFHNKPDKWTHNFGGIKIWDPASPNKFSLFSDNQIKTSTGVALWNDKLYAVNTYAEFVIHSDGNENSNQSNYTSTNQKGKFGWNGFVEYTLNKYVQGGTWNETDTIHRSLGQGDASGNFSIVAMEHGIWLCQHREHNVALKDAISQPLADNQEAICISFVPYNSNTRTWKSSWVNGKVGGSDVSKRSLFSQTTTAPVQSTPGGGMAYRKVKVSDTEYNEYIYVPNHDGNIAEVRITSWANPGTANARPVLDTANVKIIETPSAVKGDHDVTGTTKKWHTACITSMNFDYAGNLVLTIGPGNHDSSHALMIYTMPYDRTNAQEIRAPESCIYIPERLHQIGMDKDIQDILDKHHSQSEGKCAIDLYRPLQGGMFNTICLPFTVPMDHENNPLAGSEVREFTRATIESIGGENILCLEFEAVAEILFNVPYIIKPQQNIKQIMRFNWPVTLAENTKVNPETSNGFDNGNTIIYQGILPQTKVSVKYDEDGVTPLTLILVAENRLAELLPDAGQTTGTINGLRGYFQLAKKLSNGTILQITPKQSVSTSTTIIVDGKRVNIEKYLREGRVYIRMGDTLYTIDGQKVQ